MPTKPFILILLAGITLFGCKKEDPSLPSLAFQFKFDPAQERLDNLGNTSAIPSGHAAQSPSFNNMSVHYIELVPDKFTLLGKGAVVYMGAEVAASNDGFTSAIDLPKAIKSGEEKTFLKVPFSKIPVGTYRYARVSVTYQNYDIKFNILNVPFGAGTIDLVDQNGTVASFLGYNTHIGNHTVRTMSFTESTPHIQGYWAFETDLAAPYNAFNRMERGAAPSGATTVVNPLEAFGVIIPRGSCIVTGELETPLVINGSESADKLATLSFSINKSFEWEDDNSNNKLDLTYPSSLEKIVDMGLRGLKVFITE